jgi:hypothetical protein
MPRINKQITPNANGIPAPDGRVDTFVIVTPVINVSCETVESSAESSAVIASERLVDDNTPAQPVNCFCFPNSIKRRRGCEPRIPTWTAGVYKTLAARVQLFKTALTVCC